MISGRIEDDTNTSAEVTDLDSLKVNWVHDGALKEFDGGEVTFEQSFQLQIWGLPRPRAQHRSTQNREKKNNVLHTHS